MLTPEQAALATIRGALEQLHRLGKDPMKSYECGRVVDAVRVEEEAEDGLTALPVHHSQGDTLMPHYADGTEAKVGDQVVGKLYNTPGKRAGTIISITPGVESCNAMVGFLVPVGLPTDGGTLPRMAVHDGDAADSRPRSRRMRPQSHGSVGDPYTLVECADYCAINELTKVGP